MPRLVHYANKILEMSKNDDERVSHHLQFLRKSQSWPRQKMLNYQNDKLRNLISHSYHNVPYYHDAFKQHGLKPNDIKQIGDLYKLPVLSKVAIKKQLPHFQAQNLKNKTIPYRTGGSTGEPLNFYVENRMLSWSSAARYRAWEWCGYNQGDKCAMLWGASFDLKKSVTLKGKIKNIIMRNRIFNAFNLSNDRMREYAQEMAAFKPKVIRSYSSAIYTFAKYIKENDVRGVEPEIIVTTAENLYPYQRKTIEEVFNCKVYDGYGSRETSLIAHECEARQGYHISDENSIIEFLDKKGEPVAPGESGRMVITDLHNMVMPWIRYEIGDLGTPTDEKCSCGRSLSMMKSIDGRIHDMFITPDGRRIPGEFFPHLFKDVDGITEYRLTQKTREKIIVEIVKSSKFKEQDVQYLLKHMSEYLGEQVTFEFVYLDKIEWPESGKRRFTVSQINQNSLEWGN